MLQAIAEANGVRAPFASIAEAFRLIDDAMQPVIVPYDERGRRLLRALAATKGRFGGFLRKLQLYSVGIPPAARDTLLGRGVLAPVRSELGTGVLRLRDEEFQAYYRQTTGFNLSDDVYRRLEENIF